MIAIIDGGLHLAQYRLLSPQMNYYRKSISYFLGFFIADPSVSNRVSKSHEPL